MRGSGFVRESVAGDGFAAHCLHDVATEAGLKIGELV
jgi:hypothetical protein